MPTENNASAKPTAPSATDAKSRTVTDDQMLDILQRLEAQDAELQKLRDKNAELEAEKAAVLGGRRVNMKTVPFAPANGSYKFRVRVLGNDIPAHLAPEIVTAVDESEAVRWYAETHEWKQGSGIALDLVHHRVVAEPIDGTRLEAIRRKTQLAAIRKKVDSGVALNDDEAAILLKYESEIL